MHYTTNTTCKKGFFVTSCFENEAAFLQMTGLQPFYLFELILSSFGPLLLSANGPIEKRPFLYRLYRPSVRISYGWAKMSGLRTQYRFGIAAV